SGTATLRPLTTMSIRDLLVRFPCPGGPRERAVSGSPDPDSRSKAVSSRTAEKRKTPDARAPECTAPLHSRGEPSCRCPRSALHRRQGHVLLTSLHPSNAVKSHRSQTVS